MAWRAVILWLLTVASAAADIPRRASVSSVCTCSFPTLINEQLGYAYDAANHLLYRTNNALVQTFAVDALNQLSNVSRAGTFTITGALPAPASSVTVNGANAQTNADFTFASGGNVLTNSNLKGSSPEF